MCENRTKGGKQGDCPPTALISRTRGEEYYLDIPETYPQALALAKRHRMEPVFETARMFIGTPPLINMYRLFGISTFELG